MKNLLKIKHHGDSDNYSDGYGDGHGKGFGKGSGDGCEEDI